MSETEKVKKALKGITPLPWVPDRGGYYLFAPNGKAPGRAMVADDGDGEHPGLTVRIRGTGSGQPQVRNLHAIATVMNAAPALLAEIEEMGKRIEELEAKNESRRQALVQVCRELQKFVVTPPTEADLEGIYAIAQPLANRETAAELLAALKGEKP